VRGNAELVPFQCLNRRTAFKLVWSRVKEHADPARHSSTVRSSEAIAAPARLPLAAAAGGLTLENTRTATPAGVQLAR